MEVVALVISILAVLVSASAVWYARAQATEARRANELLGDEQDRQQARAALQVESDRVRWRVERLGERHLFALRNIGTDTAREVKVTSLSVTFTGGPLLRSAFDAGDSGMLHEPRVPSGGSIKFTATEASPGRPGHELNVIWEGRAEAAVVPMPSSRPSAGSS